jgi:3-isopropylmalate dehydrogenase
LVRRHAQVVQSRQPFLEKLRHLARYIGDTHAVFQPCHGTAPDIMGQGLANPTAMILSTALMLDWLADKHGHAGAAKAARTIETAVDKAFAGGLKPAEFGGPDGTAAVARAVLGAIVPVGRA